MSVFKRVSMILLLLRFTFWKPIAEKEKEEMISNECWDMQRGKLVVVHNYKVQLPFTEIYIHCDIERST